ncbi:FAD/NAD(P)-binding protein [Streptomyces sp. NPDC052225]|uniref:FAD/NAD(P)-binding protein n=1 Tax=Streptomyces sp. NPDC052225 TaxID=3154949 RepID=UPI003425A0D7
MSPTTPTAPARSADARSPYVIAVVGTGPRGLAALERLACRLAGRPLPRPVAVYAIDDHTPGSGRIWRTDQSPLLLMNTPAADVTMFSGPPDAGDPAAPPRPGAGPSLAQWWAAAEPGTGSGPHAYAGRARYGRYLEFVLDAVRRGMPPGTALHPVRDRVERMRRRAGGGWTLALAGGRFLAADQVLLATGHSRPRPQRSERELAAFAREKGLVHIAGDSAADLPLDTVPAGAAVGVIGLGMAFYDIVSLLTEGRGGRFEPDGDGLRYVPGGDEPLLVAGSRSGVPIPARGVNQKPPEYAYTPRLFTLERITALRAAGGRIDFARQVLPWLRAEMGLVHHATALRRLRGAGAAWAYTEAAVRAALHEERAAPGADSAPDRVVTEVAVAHGLTDAVPVDLAAWARPFRAVRFPDRDSFQQALTEHLRTDLERAVRGNVADPHKAAVEMLRVLRHVLRAAVDRCGLTPDSHRRDFLGDFAPLCAQLSSGPPVFRVRQVLALIRAGVLVIVGPEARFAADEETGRFTASSPLVAGPPVLLDALIDARIPVPDVRRDSSLLVQDLLGQGTVTSYRNTWDGEVFDTGGLAATDAPYRPLDARGRIVDDVCVTGVPLENVRWFTQVGSGRPGAWTDFTREADAVAGALADAAARRGHGRLRPAPAVDAVPPGRAGSQTHRPAARVPVTFQGRDHVEQH